MEDIDIKGHKPLPRKLYLRLDNSAKDNKNKYLMAFLSLLTARGVFEEIQAGFLWEHENKVLIKVVGKSVK